MSPAALSPGSVCRFPVSSVCAQMLFKSPLLSKPEQAAVPEQCYDGAFNAALTHPLSLRCWFPYLLCKHLFPSCWSTALRLQLHKRPFRPSDARLFSSRLLLPKGCYSNFSSTTVYRPKRLVKLLNTVSVSNTGFCAEPQTSGCPSVRNCATFSLMRVSEMLGAGSN